MKVVKQLPSVTVFDPRERQQPRLPDVASPRAAKPATQGGQATPAERNAGKGASFNIQLNQQLTAMQSADGYLADLAGRLSNLKLSLGRELASPQAGDKNALRAAIREVNDLLQERGKRSGNALDASLRLRLNEPVRSRFSLEGLDSIEAVQASGRETLLFSGGRALREPVAVVLDEGLSAEQVLRRFNASLGQAGIRAELDSDGALRFSAREGDWQALKGQLAVQGEGRLFPREKARVASRDEGLQPFPEPRDDAFRELRQVLDSVIATLDRISALRDQLSHRQDDVRDFLARQESQDERQWAQSFAASVFALMGRSATSYTALTQTVVAQANLSRFAVVSLLS